MRKLVTPALALAALLATSGAHAQTPDGQTPANEGICDTLHGGTPGLYGLCVAYCEAQDLDLTMKSPPSIKILQNYRKKRGPGDPDMPCLTPEPEPCPCWTEQEVTAVATTPDAQCFVTNPGTLTETVTIQNLSGQSAGLSPSACVYFDPLTVPPTLRQTEMSPEEQPTCRAQILTACDLASGG